VPYELNSSDAAKKIVLSFVSDRPQTVMRWDVPIERAVRREPLVEELEMPRLVIRDGHLQTAI